MIPSPAAPVKPRSMNAVRPASIVETRSALVLPNASHVKAALDRLLQVCDPLRVIVFGSYARGQARPGSDLDLLVVLPTVEDKRERAVVLRRALADLPVPKDVIVTTPDEIERRGWIVGTVLREALREGRVIYERTLA